MKPGDYTELADHYSRYRQGYSDKVLRGIIGMLKNPPGECIFADVGAGTGIWTRMVAQEGFKRTFAIEPNPGMRSHGARDSQGTQIEWREGCAEATGLDDHSVDLLSMASSLHWADFQRAINEFTRVLKAGGLFVALWNPRLARETPLLAAVEDHLGELKPDLRRISSGNGDFTKSLTDRLWNTGRFADIRTLEAKHSVWLSTEAYIGVWRSVNDVQVQLGKDLFSDFLKFIETTLSGREGLEVPYLTRAWCAIAK